MMTQLICFKMHLFRQCFKIPSFPLLVELRYVFIQLQATIVCPFGAAEGSFNTWRSVNQVNGAPAQPAHVAPPAVVGDASDEEAQVTSAQLGTWKDVFFALRPFPQAW